MNIEDPIDDWNIHLEIGTDARTASSNFFCFWI